MTAIKQKSMSEKIVIQRRDHEMASRIVGTVFIIVGTILVGLGIYSFVTYKAEAELNEDLKTPVLSELSSVTNEKIVELSGTAEGINKVRIFLDDVLLDTVKVKDSKFNYSWEVTGEGIYSLSVDGLKGFPRQERSNISESVFLTVDWTAPTSKMALEYSTEVNMDNLTLGGEIDPNTKIILRRGTKSYEGVSDKDGNISMAIDLLDEGKNVFGIVLEDEAGNQTIPEEKVRVTYSSAGHINGNGVAGVSDGIPEASGNLVEAMREVFNNQLMMIFGILAILSMFTTSMILVRKSKKASL